MIKYAREDVHYLLYIYDKLREELVKQAMEQGLEPTQFLKSVLAKSCDICLQRYSKPKLKDESYYNLTLRNKMILSTYKLKILKNLLKWRFKYASIEDEHPVYVLPNHMIFQLIEKIPKTPKDLHSNFKKLSNVSKKYDKELLAILNNNSQEELPEFVSDEIKTNQKQENEIKSVKNNEIASVLEKNLPEFFTIPIKEQQTKEFCLKKSPVIIEKYKEHFLYEEKKKSDCFKQIC